jgi:hypothetical protein
MKSHVLPVLTLLVAATLPAAKLQAQQAIPFMGGGIAFGSGDLAQDTNTGWSIFGGVDVTIPAVARGLGAGVAVSYSQIPYAGSFSEKTQLTTISAELSYLIGTGRMRPYLRGGAGLQVNRYDPGTLNAFSSNDVGVAFTAGAGLNFQTQAMSFLVGSRFTTGRGGGFVGLNAGVAFPLSLSR